MRSPLPPPNQLRKILAARVPLGERIDVRLLLRFRKRAVPLDEAFVVGQLVGIAGQ